MYTIVTAAAAAGRNKTAILRAIKAGRISVAKDENGKCRSTRRTAPHLSPIAERIHAGYTNILPQLHQSPLLTPV
jgi:hypothetical protein